jgi:3-oxoacyl-[acyl-carrier-protein] synthase III
MAGIRSIGWWIPEGRQVARDIAKDYGLAEEAVAKVVTVKSVPGEKDHPSVMGARATRAALEAAGLGVEQLDLLIYAGVTKDWPGPWVAAFGVLHELGSKRAAGFDLTGRCAGGIDALWLAKTLIDSGTYRNVAVCCAERYDFLLGPHRSPETVADAAYGAGAATVLVSAEADNDIVAFSHFTNPDLSVHRAGGPRAGGSRQPLNEAALRENLHQWRGQLTIREVDSIARYSADADRHNYANLKKQAGFEAVDFVVCSPMYPGPQLDVLKELGVDPKATLFTIPLLGHIGPADLFLILGVAAASGRRTGRRVVMSTRTTVYANALAIRAKGDGLGIRTGGEGLDVSLWSSATSEVGS